MKKTQNRYSYITNQFVLNHYQVPRDNRRGDISKETQKEGSSIALRIFVIIVGAILMFLVLRAMFRIQSTLRGIRENFFPFVGWIILALLLMLSLFALFTFGLNRISRKKYPKVTDKTDE